MRYSYIGMVILVIALAGCGGGGGGGSAAPIDSSDDDTGGGLAALGSEALVTAVATDATKAALAMVGFETADASLSSKAVDPSAVCALDMSTALSCEAGDVRLGGECRFVEAVDPHNCVATLDLTVDFEACAKGGTVLNGTGAMRVLLTSTGCSFDPATVQVLITGVDLTATDAETRSVDYIRSQSVWSGGVLDVKVENAIISASEKIYCLFDDVLACGTDVEPPYIEVPPSLCMIEACEKTVDCHDPFYPICVDGCCVGEDGIGTNICTGGWECNSYTDCGFEEDSPDRVPLACLDNVCQPPCETSSDCRQGGKCAPGIWADWDIYYGMGDFGACTCALMPEDCYNGEDEDGDGLIDCADLDDCCGIPECSANPACPAVENCANGSDDDGDDLIDCADPDCIGNPKCP